MKGGNTLDDEKIIGLFNERSDDAVKQLRNKYSVLVQSVIKRVLKNKSDAEECENDTYMAMWQVIPPQQPTEN